jgi:hypothetical protein
MMSEMMWSFDGQEVCEVDKTFEGFVYIITQKSTGMKYIGKKSLWCNKYFQKDGVKKKKRVESDWRNYYGSSPRLLEEIKISGKEDFNREILHFCISKSELSYVESHEILHRGALIRSDYFNDWISCKITRRHLTRVCNPIAEYLVEGKDKISNSMETITLHE